MGNALEQAGGTARVGRCQTALVGIWQTGAQPVELYLTVSRRARFGFIAITRLQLQELGVGMSVGFAPPALRIHHDLPELVAAPRRQLLKQIDAAQLCAVRRECTDIKHALTGMLELAGFHQIKGIALGLLGKDFVGDRVARGREIQADGANGQHDDGHRPRQVPHDLQATHAAGREHCHLVINIKPPKNQQDAYKHAQGNNQLQKLGQPVKQHGRKQADINLAGSRHPEVANHAPAHEDDGQHAGNGQRTDQYLRGDVASDNHAITLVNVGQVFPWQKAGGDR